MKKYVLFFAFCILFYLLLSLIPLVEAKPISPNQPGPYHIGSYKLGYFEFPYGMYKSTIRYPASYDGIRAPVDFSAAPYPIIIVANGYATKESQITWIPEHLTSYGYVTMCFTPPHRFSFDSTQWTYGFLGGLNALKKENNHRFSLIYNLLDLETIGAIGHSLGGDGCFEATGIVDSMIDTAVVLAPAGLPSVFKVMENIKVPIQFQVGKYDRIIPPEHVKKIFNQYLMDDPDKEYLSINYGNHLGFIDEFYANFILQRIKNIPYNVNIKQQHNISRKYFTAWFEYYLKNQNEYYTYIFGEEAKKDLDSGVLSELLFDIS